MSVGFTAALLCMENTIHIYSLLRSVYVLIQFHNLLPQPPKECFSPLPVSGKESHHSQSTTASFFVADFSLCSFRLPHVSSTFDDYLELINCIRYRNLKHNMLAFT